MKQGVVYLMLLIIYSELHSLRYSDRRGSLDLFRAFILKGEEQNYQWEVIMEWQYQARDPNQEDRAKIHLEASLGYDG